ncbi:MAG: hypothetical protein V1755_14760 [Chloroflexota bacterium]
MVHALEEIWRVLVAGGALIDLRPLTDLWPVEVVALRGSEEAGRVTALPQGLADDAAANSAMSDGERCGLFKCQREEFFPFHYSWDSPNDMQEYVEEEWADSIGVDEAVWARIRSLWALADADARVRVRLKMLITRWVKVR